MHAYPGSFKTISASHTGHVPPRIHIVDGWNPYCDYSVKTYCSTNETKHAFSLLTNMNTLDAPAHMILSSSLNGTLITTPSSVKSLNYIRAVSITYSRDCIEPFKNIQRTETLETCLKS